MPELKRQIPVYRFLKPEEIPIIKGWRKLDKEVDEFVFTWSRWKKWETEPPIVATVGSLVVGYHGVSFTKSGYANSASQFVLSHYRGRGLAVGMINFLLGECAVRGMSRLRFRCPEGDGGGLALWRDFLGLQPFATGQGDFWFDINVQPVTCVDDMRQVGSELHLPPTTDKRRLSYYRRAGLTFLFPEYQAATAK